MNVYLKIKATQEAILAKWNRKYSLFGIIRFLLVVLIGFSIYKLTSSTSSIFIGLIIIGFVGFFIVAKLHTNLAAQIKLSETLIKINHQEIEFLDNNKMPFENGIEFNQPNHNYAFDLDIFGQHSIFQYLNRTATYVGKSKLAHLLLNKLSNSQIEANQAAIKELCEKINFRQKLYASAIILNDNKNSYSELIEWSTKRKNVSNRLKIVSYVLPLIFIATLVTFIVTLNSQLSTLLIILFLSNLAVLYSNYKRILQDVLKADRIHETINHYSKLLVQIESENFESNRLNELKSKLLQPIKSSEQIKQLSSLFGSLISIQNAMASIIMNGTSLYHIHAYHALIKWKNENGHYIKQWLETIGDFEALNSLANFAYNNPSYCFPTLNSNYEISFEALGHPLIHASKRICNDVTFKNQPFIILTGSNMSGKSTFLRSLGINMVLAGIGAPTCSKNAFVHPLNVFVSMRLSDSLSDDESYFFAEVKRLKQLMVSLEDERGFVLLDEILRGTNSDDKRSGTIEVIKKMISYKAIGSIATHDLEVCNTTNEFPNELTNKCFEVETINNELHFDYLLREGICKNKSATFLMKKMGVI